MKLTHFTFAVFYLIGCITISIQTSAQVNIPVNSVIVTDKLDSTQNLIGGYDQDDENDRALAIHWNFGDTEFADIHIYIEDLLNEKHHYLGRTANGSATSFEWRADKPNLNPEYADGPQFGESYRFIIFGLLDANTERQWIYTIDPVEFLTIDNPTPTPTPDISGQYVPVSRWIFVNDTMESTEDLSGKWDQDSEDNRELVIKWRLSSAEQESAQFQHIYRSTREHGYEFIASIERPQNYFVWKQGR